MLLELQQMGLVCKKLTFPISYTAAPFPEAVKLLFEGKASELALISQKAERVTEKFTQNPPPLALPEQLLPCFGVVAEGERGKKYGVAIRSVQGCFDVVSSWVRFRQLCYHYEDELKDALERGVHVRVVVEKPPRHYLPKWVTALDTPLSELRTMPTPPAVAFMVFDGAEVAVAFDPSVRIARGADLWSRHAGLVAVCGGYFEEQWATFQ